MKKIIALTVLLALSFSGCKIEKDERLVVGVVPAVDSVPLFVAEKEGYFEELGVDVELRMLADGQACRDALRGKALDGAVTDLVTLFVNAKDGFEAKATTSVGVSFPLVIKADYDGSGETLKVGVTKEGIVNYLTNLYLGNSTSIEKIYVDEISERLAMLESGLLDMAVLPEPLAAQAELSGLRRDVYAIDNNYSPGVLAFTGAALSKKSNEIKLFHEAYDKAVEKINENPDLIRETLVERLGITEEAAELSALPTYEKSRALDELIVLNVLEWMNDVLEMDISLSYDDVVEGFKKGDEDL